MLKLDEGQGRLIFATSAPVDSEGDASVTIDGRAVASLDAVTLQLVQQGPVNLMARSAYAKPHPWVTVTRDGSVAPVPADLALEWTLPGERSYYLTDASGGTGELIAYYTLQSGSMLVPVEPTTTLHFALYGATHRCYGCIEIAFFDQTESPLLIDGSPDVRRSDFDSQKSGGVELSGYDRCYLAADVPAGARYAQFRIVKGPSHNSAGSYLFFARATLGLISPPHVLPVDTKAAAVGLESARSAVVFVYQCPVPVALFDGAPHRIGVTQRGEALVEEPITGEITLPPITRVSLELLSKNAVSGSIFSPAPAVRKFQVQVRDLAGQIISYATAFWTDSSYTFQAVLPSAPQPVPQTLLLTDAFGTSITRFMA